MHSPNLFQHGFPRHGLALVLDQVAKQVRLHEGQLQRAVSHVQLESFKVDDLPGEQIAVFARSSRVLRRGPQPLGAAQQAANAGDQDGQFHFN